MTEQILAVQRMQEYIETHMDEAITTADLARVSRFSPWHSYRLFHQHTETITCSGTTLPGKLHERSRPVCINHIECQCVLFKNGRRNRRHRI